MTTPIALRPRGSAAPAEPRAASTGSSRPDRPAPRPAAFGMRPGRTAGQAVRFGAIGVVSTIAYVALYAALRVAAPAAVANAVALVVTAVGNTAANRRLTFAVRGRARLAHDHAAGLLAFGAALLITTAAISVLQRVAPGAGRGAELAVLVAANATATLVRFLLLRTAIDGAGRAPAPAKPAESAGPPATERTLP